ncbi:hypothetical protein TNIN_484271 [Trichonephila inaurata madagascariensis]|uniref:Uncharacterized protein n=1 Tax=Trichonephila inaurata madagascariensis TaxID=2747483 RepID=A0A8X6IQ44_9ARAC|nr:hypothetical protein TNIN_484271 [Trichonephila inaurata madagascariensis]
MFENATKEDLVTVLHEIGEAVDSDLGILELKQKLLSCKAYLEDEEFVCDFLETTHALRVPLKAFYEFVWHDT